MHGLGDLEAAVMDVLWRSSEPMTVRVVLNDLNKDRKLAYTTVMTVLDNLHRKRWVTRELHERAWHYEPATQRDEAAAQALRDLLDSSGDPESVLLRFASKVTQSESAVLRKALRQRGTKQ